MTPVRYRAWLGGSLFVLALSAALSNTALFRQDIQGATDLTRGIPTQIGAWVLMDEYPPTAAEIRGLETRDIVKRTYSNGRDYIELVVAYIARSSRKSAHAQEACLRGAGALVGSIRSVRLQHSPVEAKEISIESGGQRAWVYYWYKMGHTHSARYLTSSWKMFLGGLGGGTSHGTTFIRLLTVERSGETVPVIQSRIEDFSYKLLPELEIRLP
jgi:EpsI family protein